MGDAVFFMSVLKVAQRCSMSRILIQLMRNTSLKLQILRKNMKILFFGHYLNLGDLVLFSGRQKHRFARITEPSSDDDNDGWNDNYDGSFDNKEKEPKNI